MANKAEQRIIDAAVVLARKYLHISRDGEDIRGPLTWISKEKDSPLVELCFAIQEAGEDVLLKALPPLNVEMTTWDELIEKMTINPDLSVIYDSLKFKAYTLVGGELNEIFIKDKRIFPWNPGRLFNVEPAIMQGKEIFATLKYSLKTDRVKSDT